MANTKGQIFGINGPVVKVKGSDSFEMQEMVYVGNEELIGEVIGVTSDTTIVQVYEEGRMPFYHFDVYRIGDIEEMDEIGYEDYFYGNGLCMIEWANLIEEILPKTRHDISIEKDLEKGFDYRKITIREQE